MFDLPLHPAIVHLPLGIAAVMPVILALLLHLGRRDPSRTGIALAVALQALALAGTVAALQTGETEEERVEDRIAESRIESHEADGQRLLGTTGVGLALLLAAALLPAPAARQRALALALVASLVSLAMAVQVGHSGGRLVHGDATRASVEDGPAPGAGREATRGEEPDD